MMEWEKLLNGDRRKPKAMGSVGTHELRTPFERDFDRVLFSTPVRRLADKTQVFPLETNDSVRTRLTHSHEVSNLSRSIGVCLAFLHTVFPASVVAQRNVPALLAAIGLAHDLGNPPFGHQGEEAIRDWFQKNRTLLYAPGSGLNDPMRQDFLRFEGNAQTIRLLTRLQVISDNYGLNLTYGMLAALIKYPVGSHEINPRNSATKKNGYFQSELDIVQEVWEATGLSKGVRHPLTYVMEACDDIAYSVMDVEDAVKKGLVSYHDLTAYLLANSDKNSTIIDVLRLARTEYRKHQAFGLSPAEINDISMQMFRVILVGTMVREVTTAFIENLSDILAGGFFSDLMKQSKANKLCKLLKEFAFKNAYQHRSVLEIELKGHDVISSLMDILWHAISDREAIDPKSRRKTPLGRYVYGRISENYRRVFEATDNRMPIRYRELQLLTDMISGMTDSFAIALHNELRGFNDR